MRDWSWEILLRICAMKAKKCTKKFDSTLKLFCWLVLIKIPGEKGGVALSPIRGNSAQKRCFFQPQVYEKVGKSFTSVVKGTKRANRCILWLWKSPKNVLVLWFIQSSELDIRKGWHLFNRRYTKEVLFLLKKQIKGQGLDLGVEPPCIKMFGVSLRVNL